MSPDRGDAELLAGAPAYHPHFQHLKQEHGADVPHLVVGNRPPLSPTTAASGAGGGGGGAETEAEAAARKKQKRNKPTLSCEECVERKTKCDRGRPACLSCVKRQSECKYSEVANLIANADRAAAVGGSPRNSVKGRKHAKASVGGLSVPPEIPTKPPFRSGSVSSAGSSPYLLSHVPYTKRTPSQVFGFGSEHPFANYWTAKGGLPEVIGVLPSKEQADYLVATFFESVDPVYPIINRRNFHSDYESFWALPQEEKNGTDPVLMALHFVVYAMGLQFIRNPSEEERAQMAEFYVAAANQALRIAGYLSRTNIRTIQTMVLICYFLMNDNHASDAWAFGGVLMRQAYAMGLNRDPDRIIPHGSPSEKLQRRKVWQAVLFQDTFLTVLLKLPPTANFSDVAVESLTDDLDDGTHQHHHGSASSAHLSPTGTNTATTPSTIHQDAPATTPSGSSPLNPMSLASIAPNSTPFPPHELSDRAYIRCMWHLANLVQSTVCNPRSLARPLTASPADRSALLTRYASLLSSFPQTLTSSSPSAAASLARSSPRQARQSFFLRSNYWHCVMTIHADENPAGSVACDVRGTLAAARTALAAFFQFWDLFPADARTWWVFQHRAFEEALLICRVLAGVERPEAGREPRLPDAGVGGDVAMGGSASPGGAGWGPGGVGGAAGAGDAGGDLLHGAKADARRVLELLERLGTAAPEMRKTRTDVLRTAYEEVAW